MNPNAVPKDQGRWFIPSTYTEHDARSHTAQKENGVFRWLTLDVDQNNLELSEVDAAVSSVIGNASRIIYATRSATNENKKWRVLIPVKNAIAGADFADTQNAFFDKLETASDGVLIPDRALARPAQLVYLPNRGAFYDVHTTGGDTLKLTADHPIIQHRYAKRAALARAEAEAKAARDRRIADRKAKLQASDVSPVDHFNVAYSVADLLGRYAYENAGSSRDYKSPMQSSGSYATRDCGDYWISLSGSDADAGIGAATQDGHRHGDPFDLYCHFEHGGNFGAAVKAYAAEAGLGRRPSTMPATVQYNDPQTTAPAEQVVAKREDQGVNNAPLFISPDKITNALAALPAADLTMKERKKIGMALCHQTSGSDEGFALWDDWSQSHPDYNRADDLRPLWETFSEGSGKPVTLRYLLARAKAAKPDYLLPDWAQGWIYNETLMEFHHVATGHSIKAGAFNAKFNRMQECFAAECTASSLALRHMRTVANTMFWPCDNDIIMHRGLDYVNVFMRHDLAPVPASTPSAEAAVQRVLDHAYGLATERAEADILLDFLAYVYQNPGKRVRWAILLFGIQGNGKSFWVELMKRLMGHNAGEVAGTTIAQRFTGWAVNRLFIAIEEIRVPSESKYAVLDKLKPFITNNEVNVELKGQDDRVVPNFASYMLLTNHDDALPLDDDDRRYCVIETRHQTKADIPGQEYFTALFGALDEHIEAIAHYFANRSIDAAFNPNGRAPDTAGKWRMMQESKSGPRLAVEEAIAEYTCDVISDRFVYVGALRKSAAASLTGPVLPDPRTIGRQLKDMGFIKHTVSTKHQGPKIDGKERAIYYRPDQVLPSEFMPIVIKHITGWQD
jgi:hypothetical protein